MICISGSFNRKEYMKHNDNYFLRNIDDIFFLLPVDDTEKSDSKMIILNETSAFLWNKLENECTIDALVKLLSDRYDVAEDLANQHVTDFIYFLSENGCLDV